MNNDNSNCFIFVVENILVPTVQSTKFKTKVFLKDFNPKMNVLETDTGFSISSINVGVYFCHHLGVNRALCIK